MATPEIGQLKISADDSAVVAGAAASSAAKSADAKPNSGAAGAKSSSSAAAAGGNANGKSRARRGEETIDVQFSKALSYILRHGAEKEGLPIRPDGYILVDQLLARPKVSKLRFPPREAAADLSGPAAPSSSKPAAKGRAPDFQDILDCVESNSKKRFELSTDAETGQHLIRAVQGHSLGAVTELSHVPLTLQNIAEHLPRQARAESAAAAAAAAPEYALLHGTDPVAWGKIQQTGGLLTMNRNHIHLAKRRPSPTAAAGSSAGVSRTQDADEAGESGKAPPPTTTEAVSGMRTSSKVIIYIDVVRALQDGIAFGVASNGAVLTAGIPYEPPTPPPAPAPVKEEETAHAAAAAPVQEQNSSEAADSAALPDSARSQEQSARKFPPSRKPRPNQKAGKGGKGAAKEKQGILPLKYVSRVEDREGKVIWSP